MSNIINHEVRLASRPNGFPTSANFTLAQVDLPPLQELEVLVRNSFMSVDPYMRGRMNEGKSYVSAFELGKPLEGGAVGEVVASRADEFQAGDAVTSNFGWREYFIASPRDLQPVEREFQPLSDFDLLLLRVVFQPLNTRLLLFDLAAQLLIARFELMHLLPFLNQTLQSVRTTQSHKRIHNSQQNDDCVRGFACRDFH